MFEDTVLRFSDKERQQQLAEQERALAERRAQLDARRQNLSHRQQWLRKDPHAVSGAIEGEDRQRGEDKRLAAQAQAVKARFGLKDGELIDTAAMRGALESALVEKEVEQAQRAEQIKDRASLLAGLNKLALIDASKTAEILHANKEIKAMRVWTRQEVADMFAKAQKHVDDQGAARAYPKTLDGWASSLAARHRELELAEIKLDAQEQALRAQVRRTIEGLGNAHEKSAEKATEKTVEPVAPAKERTRIDTSIETLSDPAKFTAVADQYARTTGLSAEQAKAALENIRNLKAGMTQESPVAGVADKSSIDRVRTEFMSRFREKRPAEKSNVIAMGTARPSAPVTQKSVEKPVEKSADHATGAAIGTQARAQAETATLNRNRSKEKEAGYRGAHRPDKPAAQTDKSLRADIPALAQRMESAPLALKETRQERKRFADMNAHEKIERRAEFLGDLREAAGFSRDGKRAISEQAKEASRPGKQRDSYGIR